MKKTLVEKFVENPLYMRLFQQERAIFDVTNQLESAMEECGVTRAQLAELLGKSRGWVTQLLDGEANKTIRTIADAFSVLGQEFRSFYQPIRVSNKIGRTAATSSRHAAASSKNAGLHPALLGIFNGNLATTVEVEELMQESA